MFCPYNDSIINIHCKDKNKTELFFKMSSFVFYGLRVRKNDRNFVFDWTFLLKSCDILQFKMALLQYRMQYVPNTYSSTWVFAVAGGDPHWLHGASGSRRVCVCVCESCSSVTAWRVGAQGLCWQATHWQTHTCSDISCRPWLRKTHDNTSPLSPTGLSSLSLALASTP